MEKVSKLFIDLKGQRFGKLVCESYVRKGKKLMWVCKCDCGKETIVDPYNLTAGHTKSCGCIRKTFSYKHGMTHTRIYKIWQKMIRRCIDEKEDAYKWYGGKGIKVCDEWLGKDGFMTFYNWSIKNGYSDDLSIDRIDSTKNYSPNNCRWVTWKEQTLNKGNTLRFTIDGVEHTLMEWCELRGLNYHNTYCRWKQYGWSIEEALNFKER